MKKTLLLFVAICCMALTYAQAPMAILTHGANMTPYYGGDALINAYNAAQDGDLITLSSGIFSSCNISKAITVRGAGMMTDTATGTTRTLISGDFMVVNHDSTKSVAFEGLYFGGVIRPDSVWNFQFTKCYISEIVNWAHYTSRIWNSNFVHCIIPLFKARNFHNTHFYNSVISEPSDNSYFSDGWQSTDIFAFDHCIIKLFCNSTYGTTSVNKIYSTNSILVPWDTSNTAAPANTCLNHEYGIGITHNVTPFFHPAEYLDGHHLYNYSDFDQVFVGFNYDVTIFADYHLLPGVAATRIGSDGTQIGIYGGSMPFDPRILNPSIGHITVGGQTNDQGQLPVTIEVVNE